MTNNCFAGRHNLKGDTELEDIRCPKHLPIYFFMYLLQFHCYDDKTFKAKIENMTLTLNILPFSRSDDEKFNCVSRRCLSFIIIEF
jgi:hypothetical protein